MLLLFNVSFFCCWLCEIANFPSFDAFAVSLLKLQKVLSVLIHLPICLSEIAEFSHACFIQQKSVKAAKSKKFLRKQ
jgi:hypothetical protein